MQIGVTNSPITFLGVIHEAHRAHYVYMPCLVVPWRLPSLQVKALHSRLLSDL
jgi:hypothetical protein